jgi:pimeloyl-ACP methyl ester carboxylesterase
MSRPSAGMDGCQVGFPSSTMRDGYGISFPAYADDLRQLFDHLELPTVTLCGVSGDGGPPS